MALEDFRLAVEAITGGKNTVLYDDLGQPSVMVKWAAQNNKDILTGGTDQTHPGSLVEGTSKLFYVSKYKNIVVNGRAISLPGQDPASWVNADQALNYCRAKGKGWGPVPYALRAQIALWCRKNGTMPHGNTNFGCDGDHPYEKGLVTYVDGTHAGGRTATGSGPATWNHNWLPDGISDLCGNQSEWTPDFRMKNGELQFIPYANIMDPDVSNSADSTAWKALNASGEFVDPGSDGTLKYDWISGKGIQLTNGSLTFTEDANNGTLYERLLLNSGISSVPEMASALMIYPDEPGGDYGGDLHYINTTGERIALVGGSWWDGSGAGVFYVFLGRPRSYSGAGVGFRSAYCDLSSSS